MVNIPRERRVTVLFILCTRVPPFRTMLERGDSGRGSTWGVEEHTAPIPQSIIWFTKVQQAESDSESFPRISLK